MAYNLHVLVQYVVRVCTRQRWVKLSALRDSAESKLSDSIEFRTWFFLIYDNLQANTYMNKL